MKHPSANQVLEQVISAVSSVPGAVEFRPPLETTAPRPETPSWLSGDQPIIQIAGDFPIDVTDTRRDRRDPQGVDSSQVFQPGPSDTSHLPMHHPAPPPGWESEGLEILAWYSPFHSCTWDWGIYIRAYGIEVVASVLLSSGVPGVSCAELARLFLEEHELGHFFAELLVSEAEVAANTALYLPGKAAQSSAPPGWGLTEEGLCNALARSRIPSAQREGVDDWLNVSPPGYRDYRQHRPSRRSESWGRVVSEIVGSPPISWGGVPGRPDLRSQVPVFLVLDGSGLSGLPAGYLLGPVIVSEAPSFWKDLKKSGTPKAMLTSWEKTKALLASGALHSGCHLEKILDNVYSVRVSQAVRAALERQADGTWLAVMVDRQHDTLYRRVQRAYA